MPDQYIVALAGTATSKDLTVSANALPVYDLTPSTLSKAVSHSSGAVKAAAGTLFMVFPTTSGDIEIKDGNTSVARLAVTAGTTLNFQPWGIPFATTITVSASAAVAVYVYK